MPLYPACFFWLFFLVFFSGNAMFTAAGWYNGSGRRVTNSSRERADLSDSVVLCETGYVSQLSTLSFLFFYVRASEPHVAADARAASKPNTLPDSRYIVWTFTRAEPEQPRHPASARHFLRSRLMPSCTFRSLLQTAHSHLRKRIILCSH